MAGMNVTALRTRVFKERESLDAFIVKHAKVLTEGDILIVTSKIVALAEGRTAMVKNRMEKAALIRNESQYAQKTKHVWLTVKDGMLMANAGVDESNANGKIILLPRDSFKSASALRRSLMKRYRLRRFGVVVTDSRTVPLKAGVMGTALGYAGFRGLREYRGQPDIFGRPLKMTRTDVADSIAASAVLLMGEGKERKPLAIVRNAPVEFVDTVRRKELSIPIEDDMYRPFFKRFRL